MKINMTASTLPPPPPPPPTPKSGKKKTIILAAALITIICVATVVLFYFNIIQWPFGRQGNPQTTNYGMVMGKVIDINGNAVSNVTVGVGGQSSTTNDEGWYSISNITLQDKFLVTFNKDGYATTYKVTNVKIGSSSFVETTIGNVDATSSINAANGGTASTLDGGSITLGANSLTDAQNHTYAGQATISITTFDPSDELQLEAFPGEYFGISAQNETGPLKSFGFMDISIMSQNGQELQIAQGKTAAIRIPVPANMQSEASDLGTCPLWYFNTTLGTWNEQGIGTYDPISACFVGNISHLSTWNFDIYYPAAYISGRVVDSSGNPVQDAQVRCWGRGWYQQRWASGETATNANGTFKRIPIEVGVRFKYQASKGGHKSAILETGPLLLGQEYNVGDIVLDAPLIQITLTWGETPSDLDSHLTARLSGNNTFHVYYSQRGSLGFEPYSNLDTDDRDSYGPEVTSISRLRQGTYRYSVRHFSGIGNIASSGAQINMIIPGLGVYRFTPPSNQMNGTDIWRVFGIVIDSTGKVTAVNTLNDYMTGSDNSEFLYP